MKIYRRKPLWPVVCSSLLAIAIAMAAPSLGFAQEAERESPSQLESLPTLSAFQAELTEVIAQVEPSIVAISRQDPKLAARDNRNFLRLGNDPFGRLRAQMPAQPAPETSGTGVVIDADGLILTQYLVIKPGDRHMVTTIDGEQLNATLKAADPRSGLAVLSVKSSNLKALPIGKAESLKKGQLVVAVGNPYAIVSDGQPTASFGAISNFARKAADQENLNNAPDGRTGFRTTLHHFGTLLQTDARLGWNASGGALVNLAGELIGITTTASTIAGHEQPAGYAIPLNETFRRVVETLKRGEEVEYGLLGVTFTPNAVVKTLAGEPAVGVQQAFAGSPADRAGLQSGDLITEIAGKKIADSDSLQLVVGGLPPSTPTEVKFDRRGQPQKTTVNLGKAYIAGEQVVTSKPPSWRGIRVDYATALPPVDFQRSTQAGMIDAMGCVFVREVDPESVSWKSGVRRGMFISHVGDTRVTTPSDFYTAVRNADTSVNVRFTQPPVAAEKADPELPQEAIPAKPNILPGIFDNPLPARR